MRAFPPRQLTASFRLRFQQRDAGPCRNSSCLSKRDLFCSQPTCRNISTGVATPVSLPSLAPKSLNTTNHCRQLSPLASTFSYLVGMPAIHVPVLCALRDETFLLAIRFPGPKCFSPQRGLKRFDPSGFSESCFLPLFSGDEVLKLFPFPPRFFYTVFPSVKSISTPSSIGYRTFPSYLKIIWRPPPGCAGSSTLRDSEKADFYFLLLGDTQLPAPY